MTNCEAKNNWTDSGDRGAAKCDHDRHYHPDHKHVFTDSTYDWEQVGQPHIAPGDGINVTPRTSTVQRCVKCGVKPADDREGKCSPDVRM
jgi:hypothetical protein